MRCLIVPRLHADSGGLSSLSASILDRRPRAGLAFLPFSGGGARAAGALRGGVVERLLLRKSGFKNLFNAQKWPAAPVGSGSAC